MATSEKAKQEAAAYRERIDKIMALIKARRKAAEERLAGVSSETTGAGSKSAGSVSSPPPQSGKVNAGAVVSMPPPGVAAINTKPASVIPAATKTAVASVEGPRLAAKSSAAEIAGIPEEIRNKELITRWDSDESLRAKHSSLAVFLYEAYRKDRFVEVGNKRR